MRRFGIVLFFFLVISSTGYSQSSSQKYSFPEKGAASIRSDGSGGLNAGYARILPDNGKTAPAGVAIFGEKVGNVLVSESGVPASPLIKNGRIYAEISSGGSGGLGTDIGLAIANPGPTAAKISYTFINTAGTTVKTGSFTLLAGNRSATYLDDPSTWGGPLGFQGTFTFNSSDPVTGSGAPVSVVALALYNNERLPFDSLITTLPVIDLDTAPTSGSAALIPYYTDGAFWSTIILLVNQSNSPMSGKIDFRNLVGAPQTVTINGQTASSFTYNIKAQSSSKLVTSGTAASLNRGSLVVTPDAGTTTPVPMVIFSAASGAGITTTQAGVPSNTGTAFRLYVEANGAPGPGSNSYASGIAIANSGTSAVNLNLELTSASDGSVTTGSLPLQGLEVQAKFLQDLFPSLTLPFTGVLRIVSTVTQPISVVGLRLRYNERNDLVMTTTAPSDENGPTSLQESDFPQIANGAGWTTQFNLFSGFTGQATSGTLSFVTPTGGAYPLTTTNLITAPPVSLSSITPTTAAVGGTVTLTGKGFSSGNTVVFTTSGTTGTQEVTPNPITSSTSLTVTVPATAINGPVFVKNGSQTSSPVLLQVTSAGGGAIQTPVTVNASSTATADIYVPAPAAGLSFNSLGLTSGFAYPASVTIAKGSVNPFFFIGTGFSPSATVSVSGGGDVTLSALSVTTSTQILVTITASATAASGPRNIVITNPNGDTSIMTGGLLIQ